MTSGEESGRGRTPPRSDEAERALLGALLLAPERFSDVADAVVAEDFADARHRAIFEAVAVLVDRGAPVDFVSVGEALRSRGAFEKAGGAQYLIELASLVTTSAHALHHAKLVADTSTLRRLIATAGEIMAEAYETRPDGEAVVDLVDASEQRIFGLARRDERAGLEPIAKAITETFRRIDAATHREGLTGLPTGFLDLDQMLCGLNGGDLVIVAARPSMGKTAFALNLIEHAALSQPDWLQRAPVCLLFSLEMGRQQLVSRMLCSRARVEGHRLRTGRLPAEDRAELIGAADELSRARIFIDDTSNLTMMSLRARARRLKAKEGLDLVVVDYLQLLTFPRSESRLQEISNISRSLKGLARELEIPVVALAQLSRQVESRDDKRPQLADLRESGSIEQDADVCMLLFRPEYYPQYRDDPEYKNMAEVIVAKQRNGPTGTVKLQFTSSTMRFENRAPTAAEPLSIG